MISKCPDDVIYYFYNIDHAQPLIDYWIDNIFLRFEMHDSERLSSLPHRVPQCDMKTSKAISHIHFSFSLKMNFH